MLDMVTIPNITPRKSVIDDLYMSGYVNKRVYLYARSKAEALQRATEHFKPKKRQAWKLWVTLANDPHIVSEPKT